MPFRELQTARRQAGMLSAFRIKMAGGFTLLELSVTMAVIGLIASGILATVTPILRGNRLALTQTKMTHIIDAISVYAQRNYRIPCPADPDITNILQPTGAEVGSGVAGAGLPAIGAAGCLNNGVAFNEGIVPYRTLGLKESDIYDAQGHYFTYRVDANYARNPAAGLTVHAWCRRSGTWVTAGANLNPMRASFCCANHAIPGQTITIRDDNLASLFPTPLDAANFDVPNNNYSGTLSPVTNNITALIFVLVSHGESGGSYLLDSGARALSPPVPSPQEVENGDGDTDYVAASTRLVSGATHFDDVLAWRTQDQIYAETGAGSCATP